MPLWSGDYSVIPFLLWSSWNICREFENRHWFGAVWEDWAVWSVSAHVVFAIVKNWLARRVRLALSTAL
jgi:hypothetical protein